MRYNSHARYGRARERESLSGLQPGSTDDLHIDERVRELTHAVNRLAAEPRLASELTGCDFRAVRKRPPPIDEPPYPTPVAPRPARASSSGKSCGPMVREMSADRFSPSTGIVLDCELADGVPRIDGGTSSTRALVLVRIFTEPIGLLSLTVPPEGLDPEQLARAIASEYAPQLRERLQECGTPFAGTLSADGTSPSGTPRFIATRERVLRDGPEITAAICTRDRPDDLAIALDGLVKQEYPRLTILVVDNAPSDDRSRRVVAEYRGNHPIDYVVEPRPGLSWARNRAIDTSRGEVIAWCDDDEVCDRWWAAELARGFIEVPEADAVTGMVTPSELETQSQALFEQYSGVARGRGFTRAVFSPATRAEQSPLYPLPPFGAGANMAFRREAIERIGRFDCALGAGTATLAGEDTAALSALLLAGGTVVWQPSAIARHRHRRDDQALRRVMLGYGRGLSAYYASMLLRHPDSAAELLGLTRTAVRDQLSRRGRRLGELEGFPPELLRINRKGLLQGAFIYPGAWLKARRLAGSAAGR